MDVRVKKLHEKAVIPAYAKEGDAGLDLTAVEYFIDEYGNHCYKTGLAFEIPERHVGHIYPRSSSHKKSLVLTNSVAVIDSGFRGEVVIKFAYSKFLDQPDDYSDGGAAYYVRTPRESPYQVGDRIAQLIILPIPHINFIESETLSETQRGETGYGSSGA